MCACSVRGHTTPIIEGPFPAGSDKSKESSHPALLLYPLTSGRSPASAQTLTDTRSLKSSRAAVPRLGRLYLLQSVLQTG